MDDDTKALEPELHEAEQTLKSSLDEACAWDPNRANTSELIRIEEMLSIASDAAKRAVSIRRRLRTGDERPAPSSTRRRHFVDAQGVQWTVWPVHPSPRPSAHSRLRGSYSQGWLAFESLVGKRRLSPIPPAWELLDDAALAALCGNAERASMRGRGKASPPDA